VGFLAWDGLKEYLGQLLDASREIKLVGRSAEARIHLRLSTATAILTVHYHFISSNSLVLLTI
jgi:hypothetical protein